MRPAIISLLILSACAGPKDRTDPVAAFALPVEKTPAAPVAEPEGDLDLPTALALTLQHHPQLQGAGDLDRLRTARVRTARVGPNPAVELTAEDFLGSGPFRGIGGSQWTLQVSQVLELGGKPRARVLLAETESALEAVQFQLTRLSVLSAVTLDFARLVFLQERQINLAAQLGNAMTLEQAIAARIEGGKESPIQLKQYQIQLALLRFDLQDLERQKQAARSQLSSNWGNFRPRFKGVIGRFSTPENLPSPEELKARIQRHPELQLRRARIAQLRAQRALEGRLAVPDVELSLGVRMVAEDRNAAMVGGLSMHLPVWDRRREARDLISAQIRTVERDLAAQEFLLEQQTARKLAEFGRHREELVMLEKTVLPEIEANIALFREGFRLGKFTLLEMLDSQKALYELRERILAGRLALQTSILELEFLTGFRLEQ
ncbi:TolC family protein [Myxococcota bacterium]|nr:TolC family protein [Myxococcota bacterium]